MKRRIRFLLPLMVFALAGCIDSEAPLSDPDKAKPDEQLLGQWRSTEKLPPGSELEALTIEKFSADGYPAGVMKFVMTSKSEKKTSYNLAFRTELKGKTYLNFLDKWLDVSVKPPAWKEPGKRRFLINKYAVKDDKLTIWLVGDEAPLKKAVMEERLKGGVRPQGYLDFEPTVRLTDTTANLAKFVAKEDENLFLEQKKVVFFRSK